MLLNEDCIQFLEAMYDHQDRVLDEHQYESCIKTLSELGFVSSHRGYEDDDSYWGIKVVYSPYKITNNGKAYVETVRNTRKENAESKKQAREAKIISIIALIISASGIIASIVLHFF